MLESKCLEDDERMFMLLKSGLTALANSQWVRCLEPESESGHDFQKTVLGTGTSVIIVFACTYCGKTFKEETKVDSGPSFSVDTLKEFGQPS